VIIVTEPVRSLVT